MKRIFSHSAAALAAGLGLRLFFVLKHPANSGDTILYEQIATNWLQHHVYAMNVNDAVTAVDLRMPGYPAFLAIIYALTRRVGADARTYVMATQAVVDLGGCVMTAILAWMVGALRSGEDKAHGAFIAAIWISALCPFTANYTAVPLTEVFAGFFTGAALVALVALMWDACGGSATLLRRKWLRKNNVTFFAIGSGIVVGLGALFRPETPLLLIAAWIVMAAIGLRKQRFLHWIELTFLTAVGCALPLAPWAIRNAVTLHELQFLAPKNSNLPGELVPYGFMAWEKTWLFRVKDCYLVSWKLNGENIYLDDIPARAFDTTEEKERVGMILEQYNNDVTLSPEEDAAFGKLAKERTARRPLRTYLWLPVARAFTIWFTPRIELLPFSGKVFPLKEAWVEDPVDLSFTLSFFSLNVVYVALALWGAWRLWSDRPGLKIAVGLLLGFLLLRTAFLTTLETPEPRYVLVCYPALLALAGQVFVRRDGLTSAKA
jgi:hypothetical protein